MSRRGLTPTRSRRGVRAAIIIVLLGVLGVLGVAAYQHFEGHKPASALGSFSAPKTAAAKPAADTAPLGEVGPGACWPSKTFNNSDGLAEAVTYLSGNDPRDTGHTAAGVTQRDVDWLSQNAAYYDYTKGETDVTWTKNTVLVQLKSPIQVMNTDCASGAVATWKVQTLPVGEWVFFLKGHAPGDGTTLIPVRKAVCGNFLLPVPTKPSTPPASTVSHCTSGCSTPPPCTSHCGGTPPPCTSKCGPPPCKTNCGPPPCHTNCGPPPCKVNCGPPPCKTNCGPPPPCNCVTTVAVQQPVQDNTLVTQSGVNIGPTKGAPTSAPPVSAPAPSNNRGNPSTGTTATKAPPPTTNGSNSGTSDGTGTPSGSYTGGGTTTVQSGPGNGNGHVSDASGGNNGTDGTTSTGSGTIANPFG